MSLDLSQATVHPEVGKFTGPLGLSRWRFESGSGSTASDYWNGNDGTINGASWVNGKVGDYALSFDGTDDYVETPGISFFDGSYTVVFWFKSTTTSDSQMFSKVTSSDGSDYIYFRTNDGNFSTPNVVFYPRGHTGESHSDKLVTTTDYLDGNWHLIVGVVDEGDSESRMYIDGSQVDTQANATTHSDTSDRIVFADWTKNIGGNPYKGDLDGVRIYPRALTETEITDLYNNPNKNALRRWVSRYSMDSADVSSGTVVDSWGSNDGTINGASTGVSSPVGYTGEAFSFDNTDDYIDIQNNTFLDGVSSISVFAWVKRDSTGDFDSIFGYAETTNHHRLQFFIRDNGVLDLILGDGNGNFQAVTEDGDTIGTEWTHVGFTWDGSKVLRYKNGVQIGTIDSITLSQIGQDRNPWIGNMNGSDNPMGGDIDEVRIYDRALSQQEVWNLYNIGKHALPEVVSAR